jgi:hypothetical protein
MLVDTSVWVDHFRRGSAVLQTLLLAHEIECHPFVIGELTCGHLKPRAAIIAWLGRLPQVALADHHEVLGLVETRRLMGRGLGWIDAHLLCSALLGRTRLWTLDRRLAAAARDLGILF